MFLKERNHILCNKYCLFSILDINYCTKHTLNCQIHSMTLNNYMIVPAELYFSHSHIRCMSLVTLASKACRWTGLAKFIWRIIKILICASAWLIQVNSFCLDEIRTRCALVGWWALEARIMANWANPIPTVIITRYAFTIVRKLI